MGLQKCEMKLVLKSVENKRLFVYILQMAARNFLTGPGDPQNFGFKLPASGGAAGWPGKQCKLIQRRTMLLHITLLSRPLALDVFNLSINPHISDGLISCSSKTSLHCGILKETAPVAGICAVNL